MFADPFSTTHRCGAFDFVVLLFTDRFLNHIHSFGWVPNSQLHLNTNQKPNQPHRRTKGFSGAEIEGVVKAAASRALERALLRTGAPLVGWGDFEEALGEVRMICMCPGWFVDVRGYVALRFTGSYALD